MKKIKKPQAKKQPTAGITAEAPLLWKTSFNASTYINSVAISGDASKIVGGTFFHDYSKTGHGVSASQPFTAGVYVFDKSQALIWKNEFQASEGVYWVSISRDGQWASGGGLEMFGQGFITIYDAVNGNVAVNYKIPARTNMVCFNDNGSVLVAGGGNNLYFFTRNGANWNPVPQIVKCVSPTDSVISVAVSGDGSFVVAGTLKGSIMLIKNTAGVLGNPTLWRQPISTIHWVAMANDGSAFVAGGSGTLVYYFNVANFLTIQDSSWTGNLPGCNSCRSVAISDDGSVISAVANGPAPANAGALFVFSSDGTLKWSKPTLHNPNSTSLDAEGKFVAVADGHPDLHPGTFYFYSTNGTEIWTYPTSNMSWPIQISSDASGIIAGSDDSYIYYFS